MQNTYVFNEADKFSYEYDIDPCDGVKKDVLPDSDTKLPAYDEMTSAEFNKVMATGLAQAKDDDSFDIDEVFDELELMLTEQ